MSRSHGQRISKSPPCTQEVSRKRRAHRCPGKVSSGKLARAALLKFNNCVQRQKFLVVLQRVLLDQAQDLQPHCRCGSHTEVTSGTELDAFQLEQVMALDKILMKQTSFIIQKQEHSCKDVCTPHYLPHTSRKRGTLRKPQAGFGWQRTTWAGKAG